MLVVGAGGLAKQLISFENENNFIFYDDVNNMKLFLNKYKIIKSEKEVLTYFELNNNCFLLAVAGIANRILLSKKFENLGGKAKSFKSQYALISKIGTKICDGSMFMPNVIIEANVSIGKYTIINSNSTVHHDVQIGKFCEIAPNVTITGNVKIEDNCFVGAGAILCPGVKIGKNSIVGAGSVVLKDIPVNSRVFGVPGKKK